MCKIWHFNFGCVSAHDPVVGSHSASQSSQINWRAEVKHKDKQRARKENAERETKIQSFFVFLVVRLILPKGLI